MSSELLNEYQRQRQRQARLDTRNQIPDYIAHTDLVKICPACGRQSLMRNANTGVWACIAAPACNYRDDLPLV